MSTSWFDDVNVWVDVKSLGIIYDHMIVTMNWIYHVYKHLNKITTQRHHLQKIKVIFKDICNGITYNVYIRLVLTKSTQGTRSTWIMKNKFEIYGNNKNGWHKKHIGHCACCMLQLSLKTQVNHKHLKMLTIFWKNLLSQSTMTRAHTYDTMVLFQPHNEPYLFSLEHPNFSLSIQIFLWASKFFIVGVLNGK